MSAVESLYYAFYHTMWFLLRADAKILTLLTLCLVFGVWIRRSGYAHRMLGLIPFGISAALGKGAVLYWAWFPHTAYLFADPVTVRNFADVQPYLSLILSIWLVFNILINLYLVFGPEEGCTAGYMRPLPYIVLFLVGLAAQIAGSFGIGAVSDQPAIPAGSRFILYACWMVICLRLAVLVWREGSVRQKRWMIVVIALVLVYGCFKIIHRI